MYYICIIYVYNFCVTLPLSLHPMFLFVSRLALAPILSLSFNGTQKCTNVQQNYHRVITESAGL